MTDRIPNAERDAAVLLTCRRVAITVMAAYAESGITFEAADAQLEQKRGWAARTLGRLMRGDGNIDCRIIADLFFPTGFRPDIRLIKRPAAPSDSETGGSDAQG